MMLTKWNPNAVWTDALENLSKNSQNILNLSGYAFSSDFPAVDIIQNNGYISIIADVPGGTNKNVQVTIENGVLTISGDRPKDWSNDSEAEPYRERVVGKFSRSFTLTDKIQYNKVEGSIDDGILTLFLPLSKKSHPNQMTVFLSTK